MDASQPQPTSLWPLTTQTALDDVIRQRPEVSRFAIGFDRLWVPSGLPDSADFAAVSYADLRFRLATQFTIAFWMRPGNLEDSIVMVKYIQTTYTRRLVRCQNATQTCKCIYSGIILFNALLIAQV